MRRRVLIVAGEASGDTHAAHLVHALRAKWPEVSFFGVGGHEMRAAGVDVAFDSSLVAVVGASEVLKHLRVILSVLRWLKAALATVKPDLVVLVDFPDFNFRVAAAAKAAGVPVFYYISPQIWAWRRRRAKFLARTVEGMAVIFPFEAELYRTWGLPAEFVGHPIMDGRLGTPPDRAAARAAVGVKEGEIAIALLPGSRRSEIAHHLDRLVEAAAILAREIPHSVFLLPVAKTLDAAAIRARVERARGGAPSSPKGAIDALDGRLRLVTDGDPLDALIAADYAVVKSGTSTLEAALCGVPFVIIYRLSALTFALGRLVVKVPFVGMANLIAGKQVARELLQHDFTAENVAAEVLALHRDPARRSAAVAGLADVRAKMGTAGASGRAAELVARLLERVPGSAA